MDLDSCDGASLSGSLDDVVPFQARSCAMERQRVDVASISSNPWLLACGGAAVVRVAGGGCNGLLGGKGPCAETCCWGYPTSGLRLATMRAFLSPWRMYRLGAQTLPRAIPTSAVGS